MKPYSKTNRTAIACVRCRQSKVRCTKTSVPCERCKNLGLPCEFDVKKSQKTGLISRKIMQLVPLEITPAIVLPDKEVIIEVMDLYFANQYPGIFQFIHKPTFFAFLESDSFVPSSYIQQSSSLTEPVLLLSILALCARLHKGLARAYGKFLEDDHPESFRPAPIALGQLTPLDPDAAMASNALKYFGWHARRYMKEVFDSPSVQRIQAFTLLSSHEWGEGNNSRSFLYVGIAARMALVLGLGKEDEDSNQIVAESKRRTIWSVYMMDRCNSSGRDRSSAIRIEDIKVRLPSYEDDFLFGHVNLSLTYLQLLAKLRAGPSEETERVSLLGYTIMVFEIWAKIAKWVGEVGIKYEKLSPWVAGSTFYDLSTRLDDVEATLPQNYRNSDFNLKMHIDLGTATHFGYFHALLLMCRVFLNREYLFCNPNSFPEGWWSERAMQLLACIESMSILIQELRSRDLMVIAPFTGFCVFTSAVTSLYFCAFPNDILLEHFLLKSASFDVESWKYKYKALAISNLETLATWAQTWELGRRWQELTMNLGIIFGQLANTGAGNINSDVLRHSMQDYGNGKVTESKAAINDMDIIRLLNSKDIVPEKEDTAKEMPSLGSIEMISPPQFLFTDSPSIFPGWNTESYREM